MPRLKKMCEAAGVRNIDIVRRWSATSDLPIEDIIEDVRRVELMRFSKTKEGNLETVESGQIVGCGEEFDNDFLRMFEDEYGSKSNKEDAATKFIREVGKA